MGALGTNVAAAQAFNRFGLGGRPDDAVPGDPVGWLRGQLTAPDPTPVAGMPTVADGLGLLDAITTVQPGSSIWNQYRTSLTGLFSSEAQAFLTNAVISPAPFRERLVWFWTNHFAVMASPYAVACVAGAYVRDAIRPYVTGTFAQMLQAVMAHPAMLFSLNNDTSVGSQSPYAAHILRAKGIQLNINENLGRETLELYTVGIGAGYTQADVDAMAYLLTGWTVNAQTAPRGFMYDAGMAQPGNVTLMGNTYPISQAGCSAALQTLATSPYTYLHLATKLVTHFISDTPSPSDITAVYNALAATGGNLEAAAQALISLPDAWTPLTKVRTPLDLLVAALRASGATAATVPAMDIILTALGQPLWCPPFPNGWSDYAADWTGPEAMLLRIGWLTGLSSGLGALNPVAVAGSCLGPLLSPNTTAAMNSVKAVAAQFTLLFCSPEFQRR